MARSPSSSSRQSAHVARVPDEVRARRRPVTGDDVDGARGEADLGGELREADRRQRRLRIGLEDDGAAGRECRRELPRRHHQRVVPGHDLARDPDRLLQGVEEERPADRVRAAPDRRDRRAVEAEVLDGLMELGLDRGDRLADIARLELGELGAVRRDRVGERVQEACALRAGRLAPVTLEGAVGCLDGTIDVSLSGHRRTCEQRAGRGLGQVPDFTGRGLGELAADEEPVLSVGRDGHGADDTAGQWSRVRW